MKHRSQPEHVRFAARLIVEAATDAFASGMCLTRAAIHARAARPSAYLAGAAEWEEVAPRTELVGETAGGGES